MKRRHLFDNGYPVTAATLIAGSHVLLAVSNGALRRSRARLAGAFRRLADTSGRVIATACRSDSSAVQLRDSRANYAKLLHYAQYRGSRAPGETHAGLEPAHCGPRPQPHHD